MSHLPSIGYQSASTTASRWAWWAQLRYGQDPGARRSRRVIRMLLVLWLLNSIDLGLTLHAVELGGFEELNPFAAGLLHSPPMLIVFKLSLVTLATVIFAFTRTRLMTEVACWGLCGLYAGLSILWAGYYSQVALLLQSPR